MTHPLQQAAIHLRAGQKDAARDVLIEFVRRNPAAEDGWLMLSLALTDPKQQADCYKRVLQLNPNNTEARDRLKNLTQPPPPAPNPTEKKVSPFQAGVLEEHLAASPPKPAPPPAPVPSVPSSLPNSPIDVEWRPEATLPPSPSDNAGGPEPAPARSQAVSERQPGGVIQPAPRRAQAGGLSSGLKGLIIFGALAVCTASIVLSVAAYGFFTARARATATAQMIVALATVSYPTLPPTWTATATPTLTATPTITATPSRTLAPTPPPPDPTVAANMDILQREVADVRGLAIKSDVQRYVIDRKLVRGALEDLYLSHGGSREEVADEAHILSALGLIKPTYDLFTNTLNGISDGLGGFYTPWTKQLYVIGEDWTGLERFIYSHEYDHALTDMHFDIAGLGVYPVCQGDEQRCDAIRALVEGDATMLMQLWFQQYATPQDFRDISNPANYWRGNTTLPEQFPPPYAVQEAMFPYIEGLEFVEYLYARGNWAEVNRAYRALPQSTEQILHPQKYLDREAPIKVEPPSLEGAIGAEWRLLKTNSLGEWMTFLLLSYGADKPAQVGERTGERAAAGWGGDAYQVYYNDGTGDTMMAVQWVWDTQADADEFKEAMLFYQDERFRAAKVNRSNGDCWEANNQASCLFARGQETLWLLAPNQTILNNILARYPNFR